MKTKTGFLLAIALVALIIVLDCTKAHALAEIFVTNTRDSVVCATVLKDGAGCRFCSPWDIVLQDRFCQSSCIPHTSMVKAHAFASPPFSGDVADFISVKFPEDWGQALDGFKAPIPSFLVTKDSIHVSMGIVGPPYPLSITGRLFNNYDCPNLRSRFEVYVYDKNTPLAPIYHGWASLEGFTKSGDITGTLTPYGSDSVVVTYNFSTNISYAGDINNLVVRLFTLGSGNYSPSGTPTLTEWGLVILVALIVASAVFIMLRRRKVAVLA